MYNIYILNATNTTGTRVKYNKKVLFIIVGEIDWNLELVVLHLRDPGLQEQLLYGRLDVQDLSTSLSNDISRPLKDLLPAQPGRVPHPPGQQPGQSKEAKVKAGSGGGYVGEGAGAGDVVPVGPQGEADLNHSSLSPRRLDSHCMAGD